MITNIYGRQKQITCDNCGDGFEIDNWQHACEEMAEEGWVRVLREGHMIRLCPVCREAGE